MAAICLALTGCSAFTPPPMFDPGHYSYTYKPYDLTFYWNIKVEKNTYYISGLVKNTYMYPLYGLEMTVTLLDAQRREVGEGTHFFIPPQIKLDDSELFYLTMNLKDGTKPVTIKFLYNYRIPESDGYGNSPYYYSFEKDLDTTHPSGNGKSYR